MGYRWSSGWVRGLDAQAVGERLAWVREREGELTPSNVVQDARDPQAPHHSYFEWDDQAAARQYREVQAGQLLRFIAVDVSSSPTEPQYVRAFVSVQTDVDSPARSYESVLHVMQDEALRTQALRAAWRELESWRRRYAQYEELAAVFVALEKLPKLEVPVPV